ncbi:DUF4876 domain-containing protein [Draconibacterium halophilum]|uniref:DUF4876 domain-containing protein n=1 Tax=Draconibacterium halophilum TaxID=2706887 RepID=A0A6C0REK3_9BACT|nr:DUF4876 domain-containing protein [Draconibacterium halophilum]QIA07953.1 DUF4876 domain-containing protein [Draconibacterium halophilum]
MRKFVLITISLLMCLLLTNCKDDVTPSYITTVKVGYPEGFTVADFPENVTVTATNTNNTRTTSVTATSDGNAIFELVEGNYNFTASFSVIGTDGEEYIFNGIISNYSLMAESDIAMNLILVDNTGGFIFKEIYYSGSRTPEDKFYYSDQFHEIYNNSGDTLYADGLCIAVHAQTSTSTLTSWVDDNDELLDRIPLTFHTWIVPGDGTEYPVFPGESFVIALDGIDHRTDENGNPNSPVNLGDANWETYVESSGKDLDASAVPNLTMIYTTNTAMHDWSTSVFGPAEVLFRLPNNDWESYVSDTGNFMTKPGSSSSTEYLMIDREFVIDAVECARVDRDDIYKRLPVELDAGYTYIEAGTYSSLSVRRKAKMIIGSRVIYKDTNNSSEDFLHDLVPTPGIHPTSLEE